MNEIEIKLSGPFVTGKAGPAIAQMNDEIAEEVGRAAYAEVHTNLNASIKHPTPYYETQIELVTVGRDRRVDDRGVIYGGWLEGTSSRNQSTKFKGYASFRRATQKVTRDVQRIAAPAVRRLIARLT